MIDKSDFDKEKTAGMTETITREKEPSSELKKVAFPAQYLKLIKLEIDINHLFSTSNKRVGGSHINSCRIAYESSGL